MSWIILALVSAIFVAIADILAKHSFNKKIQPTQLLFYQSLIIVLMVLALFHKSIHLYMDPLFYILIGIKVFFLHTFNVLYLSLLQKHEASKIVPLNNLSPVMLIFLSYFFLQETVSFINLLGIFIIIFATYYLEVLGNYHHKKDPHKHHISLFKKINLRFILTIMLMLFVISACAIIDRVILQYMTVHTNIFLTYILMLGITIACLIYSKQMKHTLHFLIHHPTISLFGVSIFFSSLLALSAIAAPDAFISLIIPLRRTSTLMVAFFAGIIFHEKHMRRKIISICFMLIGILLIALF